MRSTAAQTHELIILCPPCRTQEKVDVTQNLALSHRTHMTIRGRLEQEVTRLKTQVTHLELELADTLKVSKCRSSADPSSDLGRACYFDLFFFFFPKCWHELHEIPFKF